MHQSAIYPGLADKTVFITGGGSGIGAALTAAFAAQKARVAFVDFAEAESRVTVERIAAETGNRPLFIRCDIRDVDALKAAIERVRAELGDIGVLVNNAARDTRFKVEEMTAESWDDQIAVNLRPLFFSCQAVLPQMKRLGGGAIVNFGSIVWRIKDADLTVYSAAKAGINALTRSLARGFGPFNIRVNTVSPGSVKTERQVKLWLTPASDAARLQGQCLKSWIMPEDIADMVLFLGSDASSKCTAQEFIVDAGWS